MWKGEVATLTSIEFKLHSSSKLYMMRF